MSQKRLHDFDFPAGGQKKFPFRTKMRLHSVPSYAGCAMCIFSPAIEEITKKNIEEYTIGRICICSFSGMAVDSLLVMVYVQYTMEEPGEQCNVALH
jgi:hypothetical protein